MSMWTLRSAALLGALALAACATAEPPPPPPPPADILTTAARTGEFDTLVSALRVTGVAATLQSRGPLTLFAPTDAAFAALPEGTMETLLLPENQDKLAQLLSYHILQTRVSARDLAGSRLALPTLEGDAVEIDATGPKVRVDRATILTPDIEATNGIIHAIDHVLIPPM
jgi:uncharacterized surface protein with fasciclin (FAS1) repeats